MLQDSFFDSVRKKSESLPARQRKVCEVILTRYREAAFMTVEQLAEAAQVGVATVVRTTRSLGYPHYGEMGSRLRDLLIRRESPIWWEMAKTWEDDGKPETLFQGIALDNIESIKNSHTAELVKMIEACVVKIQASRTMAVLGLRSTLGVATYFAGLLMEFRPHVINLGLLGSDSLFGALADLAQKDLLFVISLGGPRYASRTLDAARFAYENAIPVVSLVGDYTNPIIKYSELVLRVSPARRHYSVVSAITVLEAVIASLGTYNQRDAREKMEKLASVLQRAGITT